MILGVHIPPQNLGYVDTYDPPSFPTTGPPLVSLRYLEFLRRILGTVGVDQCGD